VAKENSHGRAPRKTFGTVTVEVGKETQSSDERASLLITEHPLALKSSDDFFDTGPSAASLVG
jgi:hypothetical protein